MRFLNKESGNTISVTNKKTMELILGAPDTYEAIPDKPAKAAKKQPAKPKTDENK